MSKPKLKRKRIIEEAYYGCYLWRLPDGKFISDGSGNYMMIFSMRGNREKIAQLKDAAKGYGVTEGEPVFFPGHRPVTDEELIEQKQRMDWGLVPDPQDLPAIMDVEGTRRG